MKKLILLLLLLPNVVMGEDYITKNPKPKTAVPMPKTAFPLFSQETSDAQTHPFYPTRTHPTPVIFLYWNPPMETEIIPTEKTDSTLWKNHSIKPMLTKALFIFPHFPLEEPRS